MLPTLVSLTNLCWHTVGVDSFQITLILLSDSVNLAICTILFYSTQRLQFLKVTITGCLLQHPPASLMPRKSQELRIQRWNIELPPLLSGKDIYPLYDLWFSMSTWTHSHMNSHSLCIQFQCSSFYCLAILCFTLIFIYSYGCIFIIFYLINSFYKKVGYK